MTDPIAKGGRGHKAPYETTHVRIALGIKPVVERLSAVYRQKFLGKINPPDTNGATELIERVEAALSPVVSPVEDYQEVCVRYSYAVGARSSLYTHGYSKL